MQTDYLYTNVADTYKHGVITWNTAVCICILNTKNLENKLLFSFLPSNKITSSHPCNDAQVSEKNYHCFFLLLQQSSPTAVCCQTNQLSPSTQHPLPYPTTLGVMGSDTFEISTATFAKPSGSSIVCKA